MNKAELTEIATEMGMDVPESATKAEIQEMIDNPITEGKPAEQEPQNLTRRRDNRGSTRRIVKALEAFDAACVAFAREIDLQYFDADEDGVRTGSWDFVGEIKMFQGYALQTINDQLHPPVVEDETDTDAAPE